MRRERRRERGGPARRRRHALVAVVALAVSSATTGRAWSSSPEQTIPFSITSTGSGENLCEGGPLDLLAGPLDAGDIVEVTASAVDNGPHPYPPGTNVAGIDVLGAVFIADPPRTAIEVASEGQTIHACVDRPGVVISGTIRINPTDKLVTSLEIEGRAVIRDCDTDLEQSPPCPGAMQRIREFTGEGCSVADAPSTRGAQWRDCEDPPNGISDKNWPVMVVAGEALHVEEVRFALPTATVSRAMVSARVTIGDQEPFDLPLTEATVGANAIVANDITTDGTFPTDAGLHDLTIDWTLDVEFIDDGGGGGEDTLEAGITRQPVFVMQNEPLTPTGFNGTTLVGDIDKPYLSLVALSVAGIGGFLDPDELRAHIWSKFTPRTMRRTLLDPRTGDMSEGGELRYYPDWALDRFFSSFPRDRGARCSTILDVLNRGTGRCGGFAQILSAMLGLHGIDANPASLQSIPRWQRIERRFPPSANFMLIGPSSWGFASGLPPIFNPPGYRHALTWSGSAPIAPVLSYVAPTERVAQGTSRPPAIFLMGDHDIVLSGGRWYDPSYGTDFDEFADWVRGSVAGYATLYPNLPQPNRFWRCPSASSCVLWARAYRP